MASSEAQPCAALPKPSVCDTCSFLKLCLSSPTATPEGFSKVGHGTGTAQLLDGILGLQGEKTALKLEQKHRELIETRNNKVTTYSIKSADRNYQKNNG